MKRIRPTIVLAVVFVVFGVGCVGLRPHTADNAGLQRKQQEEAYNSTASPEAGAFYYLISIVSGLAALAGR